LYSRVETEGGEHTETDLDAVLAAVEADLELKLDETDSELVVEALPTVEADEDQLVQLFENLVKNAIEHGGAETTVTVTSTPVPGGVEIAVSDDGPGIPAEQQDEIFGLFDKGGDSDGTGIGLAICERIVARHDGEISVTSTPGEGATFFVTLPTV
jgi:signal transduction histidine kinase